MKGTLFVLFMAIAFCSPMVLFTPASAQQVEGVVILAAKKNSVNIGGRYGRPSGSASSSGSSSDSVLVWLESNTASIKGATEKPVLLNQKGLSFKPSLIVVRQNGTVRIRNSDPVYHNVFSLSSIKRFDVGRRPKGEYLDVMFDKPGAVDVFCDIHSNMRATIYVIPPNVVTWTKVKSGDSFSLENIGTGDYQLKMYALGYQERSISVEITSGEPTDVGTLTLNF